jgi:hypothetical protein
VTTSHRVTASTGLSGGGLVVRRAYAQELKRDRVVALFMAPLLRIAALCIVAGAGRHARNLVA